jgi:hypothetical protein
LEVSVVSCVGSGFLGKQRRLGAYDFFMRNATLYELPTPKYLALPRQSFIYLFIFNLFPSLKPELAVAFFIEIEIYKLLLEQKLKII